MHKVRTMKVLR